MTEDYPIIVRTPISLDDVAAIARRRFGEMAKAAVDLGRNIMAIASTQARIRHVVESLIKR